MLVEHYIVIKKILFQEQKSSCKIIIKKCAKIGGYTLIMPGVTIGENSLISAYSYIDKDVEDNKIIKK